MSFSEFVKLQRNAANLTQVELAETVGVGLRFIRDLEQGKASLRLDKVNVVLNYFGHQAGAIPIDDAAPIKAKEKSIIFAIPKENDFNAGED
ncbi:MAG: helix-turn-helix domain-containing protein [Ignavibacteria bacterium]|nr:helix-turn-helix domain-containing protein [Ignavibacteria bacterium]